MDTSANLPGIHYEERHSVDEAMGCMVPVAITFAVLASSLLFILKFAIY